MGERIGIVGTGRMGAGIARRLHDAGCLVAACFDVDRDSALAVARDIGARPCDALSQLTERSDVIITVVTDDAAMYEIFDPAATASLIGAGAEGKYFINCATVTPRVHVDVQRLCEERGAYSLEACMASSIPQAREGTLYLICAGRREVFERMQTLLAKMSVSLRYVGAAGSAAQVKALVNLVMNINTAGLAEGLGLGAALGFDLNLLREVFAQTGAASRVLETDGADMQNRDHECYFSAEHAAKDSAIALALANCAGMTLPLATATCRQYERMKTMGLGGFDKSGISELTFPGRTEA